VEDILQQLLGPQALVVFVLLILFAGWKGWWRFGRDYDALMAEKNEWKEAALRSIGAAEKSLDLHERREE
jgi:hypothetical protein